MSRPVNIPSYPHSGVGPSSFVRVENCPASVPLGRVLPATETSEYAAEGTVAHQIMETCLTDNREAFEFVGEVYTHEDFEFTVDDAMAQHIDEMLAYVRKLTKDYDDIELEVKLLYPEGMPSYGFADIAATSKTRNYGVIADLKYGAGIAVEADAIQLAIYLVSLLARDYGEAIFSEGPFDEELGETHVLQPRMGGPKHKVWTRQELVAILARMRHTLNEVAAGVVRFKPGDWCRFCPAAGPMCPMVTQQAKDSVMVKLFDNPQLLEDTDFDAQKLDDALDTLPALKLWMTKVQEMAVRYLEHGGRLMNGKLVQKQAKRQWIDEDMAQIWMEKHGVGPWQEPKLLTAPMAEKMMSKPLRAELADMVEKVSSGYTYAPTSDKRPAVQLTALTIDASLRQRTAQAILDKSNKS